MNWLMYIGGGLIWQIVGVGILNVMFDNSLKLTEKDKKEARKFILMAWLMIWVWICWRFIK